MKSEYEIAQLLEEIKRRVSNRRSAGDYPPGLEEQLEREFAEIISSTKRRYFASKDLQIQLLGLENSFARLSGQVSTRSRFPGVAFFHLIVSKITKRQILGLTSQIREVEAQVLVVLKMLGEFAQSQEEADSRVVRELSQHVLDRVSVVDHLAILTTELEDRVRNLESRFGE
jgi:hypothetical protein